MISRLKQAIGLQQKRLDFLSVEKAEKYFYLNSLSEGMTVIDAGANIGENTVLFSKFVGPTGQVHSFEPVNSTFEKLAAVVRIFQSTNVTLNNKGLYKEPCWKEINVLSETFNSMNTLIERPFKQFGIDPATVAKQNIELITLDDYSTTHQITKIDLLKIDVEGVELEVLQGARRLFEKKQIALCSFEYGQTLFESGHTPSEMEYFFKHHGYKLENLATKNRLFPVNDKGEAIFSILKASIK